MGGSPPFIARIDQVQIAQDSECDEWHRQIEMAGAALRLDLCRRGVNQTPYCESALRCAMAS